MKVKPPLISVAACALLLALVYPYLSPSPRTLSEYGSLATREYGAAITMSSDDPGLEISQRLSGLDLGFLSWGETITVRPESWKNHPGFFTYIDDGGRSWSFNGKDRTFIYELVPSGSRTWDLESYPHSIPAVFSQHLQQHGYQPGS